MPHVCCRVPHVCCRWQTWVLGRLGAILSHIPYGLKRYQRSKQSHFVTFSCHHRLLYLRHEWLRDLFLRCLERMRRKYRFRLYGYVVMPEHVHLLLPEPEVEVLATAIQALKISVARGRPHLPTAADVGHPARRRKGC